MLVLGAQVLKYQSTKVPTKVQGTKYTSTHLPKLKSTKVPKYFVSVGRHCPRAPADLLYFMYSDIFKSMYSQILKYPSTKVLKYKVVAKY